MHPIVRGPGAGEKLWVLGDLDTFKAVGRDTGGKYALWEGLIYPQHGPPPHVHLSEDETFWVLDGEFEFLKNEETERLSTGGFFYVPRGTLHTFRCVGEEPGQVIIMMTPAGFEEFFFELGDPYREGDEPPEVTPEMIEQVMELAPKYNLEVPPPKGE